MFNSSFRAQPPRLRAIATLLGSVVLLHTVASADTTIPAELSDAIKAPSAVAKFGPDLFGDKVNLYNGILTFSQTDIRLDGTGALPLTLGRTITVGRSNVGQGGRAFGIWDLDIPYLYGVFEMKNGWTNTQNSTARCSSYSAPPVYYNRIYEFQPTDYWQGNTLHVPGQGDQLMLARYASNPNIPSDGLAYPVVTPQLWAFSCLSTLADNTGAGEGFLAVAPDGIRYKFDHMVSVTAPTINGGTAGGAKTTVDEFKRDVTAKPGSAANPLVSAAGQGIMRRKEVRLLPTLITDRNGNTLTFTYDVAQPGNLKTIVASDGRRLTFTYGNASAPNLITSVTDGVRTWSYSYSGAVLNLDTVTLPDNSTWKLAGISPLFANVHFSSNPICEDPGVVFPNPLTGTMTHPSGAVGSFTLTATVHGRALVGEQCIRNAYDGSEWAVVPRYFYTNALTNKSLSGPGLPVTNWRYDYGTPNASWDTCAGDCPSTKTVTVTDPSLFVTRYTFGNVWLQTDGRLQQADFGWNGSGALRTVKQRFRQYGAGPYPYMVGDSGTGSIGDSDMQQRLAPMDQKIITQQGMDFTWEGSSYDVKARPTVVSRSSGLGSRTETTAFSDNLGKWVLGQTGSVTESSTGKVMVQNTFDTVTSDLLTVSQFGLLKETRTYYADGTLKTSKDGLNQTTTFSSYLFGIPRLTSFADGKTKSFVVSPSYAQINSTTDETGATTSFTYDGMGRLFSIVYPASDSVAWNATNLRFEQVPTAEYGLPAGHWRKTVFTGNGNEITYFDAQWRPVLTRRFDAGDEANTSSMVLRKFDYNGATVFESYPQRTINAVTDSVNGTTTTLDALGRPTNIAANSELGTLNTGFYYNQGFNKTIVNPLGFGTVYGYQTFDQPSENAITVINEPYGITTHIGRDVFGKTTSIYKGDAGVNATHYYVYDAHSRLCKTIEPEGTTVQDYDAAGNVKWRAFGQALPSVDNCDQSSVPAANKVVYGYDTRNRLLTTSYSDGSAGITRTLFGDGKPNTIASNGTAWTYGYNKRRLLETETLNYLGKNYVVKHGFDANGYDSSLTYPDIVATKLPFLANQLGQTTQVGDASVGVYINTVKYHPNGAIASFNYGSGIAHAMGQNIRGLPQQGGDVGVINDSYTYDENGNVKGITDNQEGVTTRTMQYNDVDALTNVTAPNMWGSATYANDALGNVRGVTVTQGPTARTNVISYDPVTNRVDNISGVTSFQYDRQGNVKTRGADQYVFDMANRMTSATGKASYVYDGWGRRVATTKTDGSKQIQVYTQDGMLVYATNQVGTGAVTEARYGYFNGSLIAELGVAYIHTDALRSPVARTDAARNVLSRTRYEPYGLTAAGATPTIGFTGHVNDAYTGLVYMQQRYYDPISARFLSIDPALTDMNTARSFNRYAYTGNNPYGYVDPDGRDFCGSYQCEKYDAEGRSDSLTGVVNSLANGVQANIIAPIEAASDATSTWLDEKWNSYLDFRQARSDLLSAALHGDKVASDQVALEIAMGFAGTTSSSIAAGHAFEKHVLGIGARLDDPLFRGLGIRTVAQLEAHVAQIMANPTAQRALSRGRTAYLDAQTGTVVIHNPRATDLGTVFRPSDAQKYFNNLK
ncbi:RHS repeat domain-containing protein [Duganella violaceipulchra]|uniref:RHS repeat-associated core domain-containing protein n=1 Tax=Duganella violaceipulchra TaxID=2849652 RepID=A0AA41L7Z1_9BURK|nr:RHS repeat-associated core domain-containing protein [Duganella violaceicalia]MBV6324837.1 RHS repeat-associated core domain-containing protein [Duganella violaceicalia]MCP2012161.1 RHS repeat-associated protein [Duganella violaceicalia]